APPSAATSAEMGTPCWGSHYQARTVHPLEPRPPRSPPVVYESPITAIWFTETARCSVSGCLTVIYRALSMPTTRAIATTTVTSRFTGTAYDPTREKVGVDQIVHNVLRNCC